MRRLLPSALGGRLRVFADHRRASFALQAHGTGYFDTAPFAFENSFVTTADPERTFDAIVDIDAEREWFPDFSDAAWLTAEPRGVGSLRDYRLTYMRLTEHFLVWDRGVRVAFEVTEASLPLVTAFAEDYVLTPMPNAGTRVDWRVCYTPNPKLLLFHPVLRPIFARDFRLAAAQLTTYCDRLASCAA